MSPSDSPPPSQVIGTCVNCRKPIRKSHGWLKRDYMGGQMEHFPGPCSRYHAQDAYNLLRRIRRGSETGDLGIPDVAHAVEAEITEMVGK